MAMTVVWSVLNSNGTDWMIFSLPTIKILKPPLPRMCMVCTARSISSLSTSGWYQKSEDPSNPSLMLHCCHILGQLLLCSDLLQSIAHFTHIDQASVASASSEADFNHLHCQLVVEVSDSKHLRPEALVCCTQCKHHTMSRASNGATCVEQLESYRPKDRHRSRYTFAESAVAALDWPESHACV
jgi:hypothetical protein